MDGLSAKLKIPDFWQQKAVQLLQAGKDVVVHAPTGAGKTYIFELLVESGLKRQAIFTVPTRALANDKLHEWRDKGWKVGICTGDVTDRPEAAIVVATLETQKGRFLRGEGPGLLVIDEYQMLADARRGINYELAIALAPPGTQLLLLSGSVANPGKLVGWLRQIGRDAELVHHTDRPVPQDEINLTALPDRLPSSVRGFWPQMIGRALAVDLGPILLFAPQRREAEVLAHRLAAALPIPDWLELTPEQRQIAGDDLAKLLRQRVAYHHSGLNYLQRAGLIEPLAKAGQLRVIVATTGLAAGINFSMRSVCVTEREYRHGGRSFHVRPDELLQMFGRAGRRGLDDKGFILHAPGKPRLAEARPANLKRANSIDWPSIIAVMHEAEKSGRPPITAADELATRLFTEQRLRLGLRRLHENRTKESREPESRRAGQVSRATESTQQPHTPTHRPEQDFHSGDFQKALEASLAATGEGNAVAPDSPANREVTKDRFSAGHRRPDTRTASAKDALPNPPSQGRNNLPPPSGKKARPHTPIHSDGLNQSLASLPDTLAAKTAAQRGTAPPPASGTARTGLPPAAVNSAGRSQPSPTENGSTARAQPPIDSRSTTAGAPKSIGSSTASRQAAGSAAAGWPAPAGGNSTAAGKPRITGNNSFPPVVTNLGSTTVDGDFGFKEAAQKIQQMLSSSGEWERLRPRVPSPLGLAMVYLNNIWQPALGVPQTLESISVGNLCHINYESGERRYGRQVALASFPEDAPARHKDKVVLVRWLMAALKEYHLKQTPDKPRPRRFYTLEQLEADVIPLLPLLAHGGSVHEIFTRKDTIYARLDYAQAQVMARVDSMQVPLLNPPRREVAPPPFPSFSQIASGMTGGGQQQTPAQIWHRLGLIDDHCRPTRRGVIFSFFNHGEGLAIAAALEDASYPLEDLLYDVANLRAGHRFEHFDNTSSRLGNLCRLTYQGTSCEGYLDGGVPPGYGHGAAEVLAAVQDSPNSAHEYVGEELRQGDIERAALEWRSLLHHIAFAPDYPWNRWQDFCDLVRSYVFTHFPIAQLVELPGLTPAQKTRLVSVQANHDILF